MTRTEAPRSTPPVAQHDAGSTAVASEGTQPHHGRHRRLLPRLRDDRASLIAGSFLAVLVLVAVFAPLLATHDPTAQDLVARLQGPGAGHVLGTDELGRDVFSRLLFAGRVSLLAAAIAVLVGMLLGIVPGLVSGYFGGWIDSLVMRITDAFLSFPPIILALAVLGALGPSLVNAMIAIGIIFAPRYTRLVRGAVLSVREEAYIEASRSIGTPSLWIVRRHVVPNVMAPVIVQTAVFFATGMIAEAGLSFLGLGVQPPDASWGSMLGRAFKYILSTPWLVVFPGLVISLAVLAANQLADGLRDAIARQRGGLA